MSKRSRRRKRREKQSARLNVSDLIQQGSQAFQQANYDQAIKAWEQAQKRPNAPGKLAAALAEAYFRRAMSDPSPRLADLQQAARLQPAESRYRYHLALAYHRQGELAQAEPLYRKLLAKSPLFERAAAPLAQLLIEQKKAVLKDPVWEQLNPAEQTQLAAAEAVIKQKADSTLKGLAGEPLDPLWQGLVALALDDKETARQSLQTVVETANGLHPLPRGVAHYYLGVMAAAAGQTETALAHWQAARSGGLNSGHLRHNLSALAYEQAVQALQAGQPRRAMELLEQVRQDDLAGDNSKDFYHQLNLKQGYAAAQKGDWAAALDHWQKAEQAGDDSRRLIFNLALAHQHQENYWEAAEHWRTLLRRRPRKADHPDALTDQQVARIWQNVAENYSRAGEYEESIKTYKNAVKWAPDNIDLRLQLVEAYQNEGRWQAAENELHRILDKEPDNVPALVLLAESYSGGYYAGQARQIWRRVLELEPENPVARQQLAHSYAEQGERYAHWGYHQKAIDIYQEGLEHVPNNQRLLTMIGGTYADWGKMKEARHYLDQAIARNPNDLTTLYNIYRIWLDNGSRPDLQQTFERIKAVSGPIPGAFFLDLFDQCLDFDQPEEGEKILKYAEARYTGEPEVMVGIALGYLAIDQISAGRSILRQVLKENPKHIEANIQLGILYHRMDQTRLAKRHWDRAQSQANQENNQMALHRIKLIKDEFLHGKPPPRNLAQMFMSLPPQAREELLKQAPPEVAEMLRNIDPEMLEMMFNLGGLGGFDEEFFDEDDFYYV